MSELTPTFTDLLHKQDKSLSLHPRPLTTKTADEFLKEAYRIVRQHLPSNNANTNNGLRIHTSHHFSHTCTKSAHPT